MCSTKSFSLLAYTSFPPVRLGLEILTLRRNDTLFDDGLLMGSVLGNLVMSGWGATVLASLPPVVSGNEAC